MSPENKWYGAAAEAALRVGAIEGLEEWALDILVEARPNVPVSPNDGGFMRDSGEVSADADKLQSAVSYSSPPKRDDGRAPAKIGAVAIVHENLYAKHTVGGPKFLEKACQVKAPDGLAKLANSLRRRFR